MKNLVLSGGGINGIALLGVVKALTECQMLDNIEHYIGNSVGSIISFLLCINYNYNDLLKLILSLDLNKLIDIDLFNIFSKYGMMNNTTPKKLFIILLKKKLNVEDITFKELFDLKNTKLTLVATNINIGKEEYFNYINTPDVSVIDALIASCSIPILFQPIKINGALYIDGMFYNNCPHNVCENEYIQTICINMTTTELFENIDTYDKFLFNLYKGITTRSQHISKITNKKPLIYISLNLNQCFNLDISNEEKHILFNMGYEKSVNIIKNYIDKKKYKNKSLLNLCFQKIKSNYIKSNYIKSNQI